MMGRARILWSHTRDMRVDISNTLIKYTIPALDEVNEKELGDFIKAEKQGHFVVVYYQRLGSENKTEIMTAKDAFTVDFQK